ncbi:hypothetical protein HRI_004131500 [Hibiscus trionum]|uniref:Uncharacterized protein n=1 Tax=Hibiscus trionum TaxID=183268 RepID=A0A9W7IY02_HIBTR|nr:hypothetical protein HRI_004131500 [Hibiscus trionum]
MFGSKSSFGSGNSVGVSGLGSSLPGLTTEKVEAGNAEFLVDLENRRAIKVFGKSTLIGLPITFFAGICFFLSLFSPTFNSAKNDEWQRLGLCSRDRERSPVDGRPSSGVCGCRFCAGTSTCEHVLGRTIVRRIPEIVRRTHILVSGMLFMFSVAIGIPMASSGHRK